MKINKLFILLLFLINTVGFILAQDNNLSGEKFALLNRQEKINFLKNLDKKERIHVIYQFMQNRTFDVRPYSCVKFYPDGEFICDADAENGGMVGGDGTNKPFKYFVGKWQLKNNEIVIDNTNSKNIRVFRGSFKLDDVYIEEDEVDSTHFVFHVSSGYNYDKKDITNHEVDLWGGVLDSQSDDIPAAIKSYTKLKQIRSSKQK